MAEINLFSHLLGLKWSLYLLKDSGAFACYVEFGDLKMTWQYRKLWSCPKQGGSNLILFSVHLIFNSFCLLSPEDTMMSMLHIDQTSSSL